MKTTVTTRIKNGLIKGCKESGTTAFKGIPFAKPPIGEYRFKAPVPCEDWEGVLDCTEYGPRPIQVPPPWCVDRDSAIYAEDCLNINVWTPNIDGEKRPVIFNIFGGGFMEGSNSEIGSEGYRLMKERNVVVVSPNYRVGALGALYLREIFGDEYKDSGNLTLLDQILALKWVKGNIEYFGGDPGHVVIVGQSAGGKSVLNLMLAKECKGLFHGAVAMSGALQAVKDTRTMHNMAMLFLKMLDIPIGDPKVLEEIPVKSILDAQERMNQVFFKAESYGATADGLHLPIDVEAAVNAGDLADVPLIIGHTKEELFMDSRQDNPDIGLDNVKKKLYWKFGDNYEHVLNVYRERLHVKGYQAAWGETVTEYTYVQAYERSAEVLMRMGRKCWLYRWDYKGGSLANHSSDNEALFSRTNAEKVAYDPILTATVDRCFQDLILNFVEFGNPVVHEECEWMPYSKEHRERLLIDEICTKEEMFPMYDKEFPLQVFRLEKPVV